MKIYLTIAECMGTDNEFTSEVYTSKTSQEAGEHASSLIAKMAETMNVEDIDPTSTWELEGDDWFYRVRIEEHEIPSPITKQYATDINWDIDGDETPEELGLPNKVEIPTNMDIDTFADWLSDEYGYCHLGFYIESIEVEVK
jgi:hypothetical protein